MSAKPPEGLTPVLSNPLAPDVFADDALSFSVADGVVRITFTSSKASQTDGTAQRVVIGRLVMPTPGAQRLALGLYDFLKNHGLDAQAIVGSAKAVQ